MKICLTCGQRFVSDGWGCPRCHTFPELTKDIFFSFAPGLAASNEGFCAGYFEQLFKAESKNFWFRSRNQLLVWALRKFFPDAQSFFEIGCGTGYVLSAIKCAFPSLALYGSDVYSDGLIFAKQRLPSIDLLQIDARRIPFEMEFDVIGAFDVLEHINEDNRVLHQMFRATKPEGGIIITVPQHPFLWSIVDEYSCHKRRYSKNELAKKVTDAGFHVMHATSFVSILLPFMLLSRIRRNRSLDTFDPMAEIEIGRNMNAVLEKILAVERLFIRCGFSLPVGGSLLMIAKRDRR